MAAQDLLLLLMDVSMKGFVLLFVAGLATLAMRRRSAAERHLVWLLAILGTLALPVFSVCLPSWRILPNWSTKVAASSYSAELPNTEPISIPPSVANPPLQETSERLEPSLPTLLPSRVEPVRGEALPVVAAPPVWWKRVSWPTWQQGVVAAWLLGMAAMLFRYILGLAVVWRIGCMAKPVEDEGWLSLLRATSRLLEIRRLVALRECPRRTIPMTWGILRPVILLPNAADAWPDDRRQAVLMHELAHVRRRDCLALLIAQLAMALYWFNPLVWLAWRRLLNESERACDDLVLSQGSKASDYAEHLLGVAAGAKADVLGASAAIAMARPSQLHGRLLAILDEKQNRRRLTRLALGMALAVVTGVVVPLSVLKAVESNQSETSGGGYAELKKPGGVVDTRDRSEADTPKEENKKSSAALLYTGQVIDKQTSKPIGGARVTVLRRVGSRTTPFSEWRKLGETEHQTGADGRYTFTVPPEQVAEDHLYVEITITHTDYVRFYGGYSFAMIRKNEKLGELPFFARLALEPAMAISGTIVAPDGKPAKDIKIKAWSAPNKEDVNHSSWGDTKSDEKGRFQLGVHRGGEAILWILPDGYSPSTHVLHANRGDLGRFTLERGLVLRGRVVDNDGKPLKNVWVNADIHGGPAKQQINMPVFDHLSRSALSNGKGEFAMMPLPAGDYELIVADRPRSGSGKDHPLPAVFLNREITLDHNSETNPIEIRAVPHVLIAGQFFDGSGKPTSGYAPRLSAHDEDSGSRRWFWDTAQIDKNGKFTVKSPSGFAASLDIMDNEHHAIKWRLSKNAALGKGRNINLGMLNHDMTDIAIIRYTAPVLLVKVAGADASMVDQPQPRIVYKFNEHEAGGQYIRDGQPVGFVAFERQSDGRWRSSQLLPNEEFALTVKAKGFEPITEMLTLPEGAVKELEVRLKKSTKSPATPVSKNAVQADSASVPTERAVDRTPATPENAPGKRVEGQAVDAVTGKPVAAAVIKAVIRQMTDETGKHSYGELETRTTNADSMGRFTVIVPDKYMQDSSKRETDMFVTAAHDGYVTTFSFGQPRQIAQNGVTDDSAGFRLIKMEPAREIYGQAVDAQGRPLAEIPVYKSYHDNRTIDISGKRGQTRDADNPIKTDREGRFRTKVAARAALDLEFRTAAAARNYQPVPLDRTDLGVIRIVDGIVVTGRVVDGRDQPVRGIMVTSPLQSKTERQPDFCYFTDGEGRFKTDKLSLGDYLFKVGGVYRSDDHAGTPIADAPGVYLPLLVKVRVGKPVAELALRPTRDVVRCTATLFSTRPKPALDKQTEPISLENEAGRKLLAELFLSTPIVMVRGLVHGSAWDGTAPSIRSRLNVDGDAKESGKTSSPENSCSLLAPKGLVNVTMDFGMCLQRFQLDDKSPKLFGFGIHLDRIDHDLTNIKIYRYRETRLDVHVEIPEGKKRSDVQLQAHYVREKLMRDAGAVLMSGTVPFLKPEEKDGEVTYSVLPEEEIELSVAMPGMKATTTRVQLKDGEFRKVTITPVAAIGQTVTDRPEPVASTALASKTAAMATSGQKPAATASVTQEQTPKQEMLTLPVRVVDADGHPVANAKVIPWALRSSQGHGLWCDDDKRAGVGPKDVVTDKDGIANILYPRYRDIQEQTRTILVSLYVDHPKFAFTDGLHIDVPLESKGPYEIKLTSGVPVEVRPLIDGKPTALDSMFLLWSDGRSWRKGVSLEKTPNGTLRIPAMRPGKNSVLVVKLDGQRATHFSKVFDFELTAGRPETIDVPLRPSLRIEGVLSDNVPRPVRQGRIRIETLPPANSHNRVEWFSWTAIQPDGTFTIDGWPADERMQLIALCDGYIATSGRAPDVVKNPPDPKRDSFGRPQVFDPGKNSRITVAMSPLVRCVASVLDEDSKPIAGVTVVSSPNVGWWNGGSQIYCDALARGESLLRERDYFKAVDKAFPEPFQSKTNAQGKATLELPAGKERLAVMSDEYELPVFLGNRRVRVELVTGQTTEVTLRLQKHGAEKLGEWDKLAGVVFGCSTREGRRICALPEVQKKMEYFEKRFREGKDLRDPKLLSEAYDAVADAFTGVGDLEEAAKWRKKAAEQAAKARGD